MILSSSGKRYIKSSFLGKGSFGSVYRLSDPRFVMMKMEMSLLISSLKWMTIQQGLKWEDFER